MSSRVHNTESHTTAILLYIHFAIECVLVSHAGHIPECNRANDARMYTIFVVAPHFVDSTLAVRAVVVRDTSNPTIQYMTNRKKRKKKNNSFAS